MIEFKSQTMRQVLGTMMDIMRRWQEASDEEKEDLINPDAPIIVQCGDYGYEVQSIGGDGDIDGFVIMLKPEKVCKWEGIKFTRLKGKK